MPTRVFLNNQNISRPLTPNTRCHTGCLSTAIPAILPHFVTKATKVVGVKFSLECKKFQIYV